MAKRNGTLDVITFQWNREYNTSHTPLYCMRYVLVGSGMVAMVAVKKHAVLRLCLEDCDDGFPVRNA